MVCARPCASAASPQHSLPPHTLAFLPLEGPWLAECLMCQCACSTHAICVEVAECIGVNETVPAQSHPNASSVASQQHACTAFNLAALVLACTRRCGPRLSCATPQEVEAFAGAQQLVSERGRDEGRAQRVIQVVPAAPQRAGALCGPTPCTSGWCIRAVHESSQHFELPAAHRTTACTLCY